MPFCSKFFSFFKKYFDEFLPVRDAQPPAASDDSVMSDMHVIGT